MYDKITLLLLYLRWHARDMPRRGECKKAPPGPPSLYIFTSGVAGYITSQLYPEPQALICNLLYMRIPCHCICLCEVLSTPHSQLNRKMNEVLMAIMSDHKNKVNQMGSLTEEDIPQLCKNWKKSCKNIMNGALEILPPLWEVNHQIPIINENKRYKYHMSRCPGSLKNELSEEIMHYTCAKWWEPTQVEQAALIVTGLILYKEPSTLVSHQQSMTQFYRQLCSVNDKRCGYYYIIKQCILIGVGG